MKLICRQMQKNPKYNNNTFSEKYLKCEACKLHCREKSQTWCQKILLPVLGLRNISCSAWLNLKKNSLQDGQGGRGLEGGRGLWTCVLGGVYPPSSAPADSGVTRSLLHSGFPHQAVPPTWGSRVSDTRRGEHLLFTWSPSWESNLCLLLLSTPHLCQCPSASIFPESMKVGP